MYSQETPALLLYLVSDAMRLQDANSASTNIFDMKIQMANSSGVKILREVPVVPAFSPNLELKQNRFLNNNGGSV